MEREKYGRVAHTEMDDYGVLWLPLTSPRSLEGYEKALVCWPGIPAFGRGLWSPSLSLEWIESTGIVTKFDCLASLHELGHLVKGHLHNPHESDDEIVVAECEAWLWAIPRLRSIPFCDDLHLYADTCLSRYLVDYPEHEEPKSLLTVQARFGLGGDVPALWMTP